MDSHLATYCKDAVNKRGNTILPITCCTRLLFLSDTFTQAQSFVTKLSLDTIPLSEIYG